MDVLSEWMLISGFCLTTILTCILVWRRLFREHVYFALWIAGSSIGFCVLYAASRFGSYIYVLAYLGMTLCDALLQVLVVYGFARQALTIDGEWLPTARAGLVKSTLVAMTFAAFVECYAEYSAAPNPDPVFIRISLPCAVFVCVMTLHLLRTGFLTGFVGTILQRRCLLGFVVWTFMACLTETLRVTSQEKFTADQIVFVQMVVGHLLLLYWIAVYLTPPLHQRTVRANARPSATSAC